MPFYPQLQDRHRGVLTINAHLTGMVACPYGHGIKTREVGANPRVRPVFPFTCLTKISKILRPLEALLGFGVNRFYRFIRAWFIGGGIFGVNGSRLDRDLFFDLLEHHPLLERTNKAANHTIHRYTTGKR